MGSSWSPCKTYAHGELIGTAFAVWAPNARNVSLISDLNFWDKKTNPMIPLGSNGLWEVFIPDLGPGTKYKFANLCYHLTLSMLRKHTTHPLPPLS